MHGPEESRVTTLFVIMTHFLIFIISGDSILRDCFTFIYLTETANGSGRRSTTDKYPTEMEVFKQSTEEHEPFIPRPVIVPSFQKLPMIMCSTIETGQSLRAGPYLGWLRHEFFVSIKNGPKCGPFFYLFCFT